MQSFPESPARCVQQSDADYPAAFHNLREPPERIWIAGTLSMASPPAVAIVGTRNPTPYGLRAARSIANTCARAGVCVVSGMARGIDGAAHQATLDSGGRTVAVLGTGFDFVYPRTHRAMQQRIAQEGLLVSEMQPDQQGHGGAFPRRNRLIAALSQLVIVVEAGVKSGTQLTVEHAHALGIQVAAVPGPIDVPQAEGSNQMLKDGAAFISTPADVLALLRVDASPLAQPMLSGEDAAMWDALSTGAADVATLARRAGLSLRSGASAVSTLEIAGLVQLDALGTVHVAAALTT